MRVGTCAELIQRGYKARKAADALAFHVDLGVVQPEVPATQSHTPCYKQNTPIAQRSRFKVELRPAYGSVAP